MVKEESYFFDLKNLRLKYIKVRNSPCIINEISVNYYLIGFTIKNSHLKEKNMFTRLSIWSFFTSLILLYRIPSDSLKIQYFFLQKNEIKVISAINSNRSSITQTSLIFLLFFSINLRRENHEKVITSHISVTELKRLTIPQFRTSFSLHSTNIPWHNVMGRKHLFHRLFHIA